jgi:hypothetical protein
MPIFRHLIVAALALALMLASALPALAGESLGATVKYKGKRSGDGTLLHQGGRNYTLIACDVLKDGYSIYAWASSVDGAFDTEEVRDVNGAQKASRSGRKGCDVENITLNGDVPELTVCSIDRDENTGDPRTEADCSTRQGSS